MRSNEESQKHAEIIISTAMGSRRRKGSIRNYVFTVYLW